MPFNVLQCSVFLKGAVDSRFFFHSVVIKKPNRPHSYTMHFDLLLLTFRIFGVKVKLPNPVSLNAPLEWGLTTK